jgi:hypothetical protein
MQRREVARFYDSSAVWLPAFELVHFLLKLLDAALESLDSLRVGGDRRRAILRRNGAALTR